MSPLYFLATVHGLGAAAEKLGVIAAAMLAALVVLGRPPLISERRRALALLVTLVLTPVLLVVDVWHTSQLTHLRHHPVQAVLAIVLGAIVVAALAAAIHRWPRVLPPLAILALPFRLPIATGPSTSNLLIPLYLVVAAGALAYAIPRLKAARPAAAPVPAAALAAAPAVAPALPTAPTAAPAPGPARPSARLEWLLMAAVVVYALQASYSSDFSKALENAVFFYIPFALLFMLLRDVRWNVDLALTCLGVAGALAVVFAGIGFVEYSRKTLFLNPKVLAADQYGNYFRVNSLFFDPNVYGRFLALVMIAVMTVVLWSVRRRPVLIGAGLLAWLMGGLITSFSQSSIAALLLGMAVLAAHRWDARSTAYVTVALVAIATVFVLAAPPSLHFGLSGSGGSANNATSGRAKLISGGLDLFAKRPLYGHGSGSFETEYQRHSHTTAANATSASHTTPVTVAAEQGLIGLVLYVALLLAAFVLLLRDAGRSPPRIALAACFAGLVLHTWVYADFLEDPMTWTLLGIGVAFAALPGSEARSEALASALDGASRSALASPG
jgi:O-antigen ligase